MKLAVAFGMVAVVAGAYVLGRYWFDEPANARAPIRVAKARRSGDERTAATTPANSERLAQATAVRGELLKAARAQRTQRSVGDDDATLEAMIMSHRTAMHALREAIYHGVLPKRGLAVCEADADDDTVCWVRFDAVLQGQLMTLRPTLVECDTPGRPKPDAERLQACVLANLVVREPVGIPAEVAEELGDYRGPVEAPMYWYF